MIGGVKRERLREGRRLRMMGGGGASRRDCYDRNNIERNNELFPFGQGKYPQIEGKKSRYFPRREISIDLETVVLQMMGIPPGGFDFGSEDTWRTPDR
jgi:hypothetical protein